jgi:hypothetical protein
MSFMLVYYAEHYVIDIVAGFAATGLVLCGCAAWERSRAPEPPRRELELAVVPHQRRSA